MIKMLGFQATQVIFERSCKTDSERMTKMDKYDFDQTGKGGREKRVISRSRVNERLIGQDRTLESRYIDVSALLGGFPSKQIRREECRCIRYTLRS